MTRTRADFEKLIKNNPTGFTWCYCREFAIPTGGCEVMDEATGWAHSDRRCFGPQATKTLATPTTTIINLYGGPGTGKSTSAAFLFYLLKTQGLNAELVREYVKDWAWEGRHPGRYDQPYFLGKQARKESMLYGKVSHIVTDCPVLLSRYYAEKYAPERIQEGVKAAVTAHYRQAAEDGYRHIHVFLHRTKQYNAKGRYQTEEEAKAMDAEMDKLLFDGRFTTHIIAPNCLIKSGTSETELRDLLARIQQDEKTYQAAA